MSVELPVCSARVFILQVKSQSVKSQESSPPRPSTAILPLTAPDASPQITCLHARSSHAPPATIEPSLLPQYSLPPSWMLPRLAEPSPSIQYQDPLPSPKMSLPVFQPLPMHRSLPSLSAIQTWPSPSSAAPRAIVPPFKARARVPSEVVTLSLSAMAPHASSSQYRCRPRSTPSGADAVTSQPRCGWPSSM